MTENLCPRCGSTMQPVTIGDMHDKFMHCEHCGYKSDVPDEVTIEDSEEFGPHVDEHGRTVSQHKRTRRVTRRDLTSDEAVPSLLSDMLNNPDLVGNTQIEVEIDGVRSDVSLDELQDMLGSQAASHIQALLADAPSYTPTPSAMGKAVEQIDSEHKVITWETVDTPEVMVQQDTTQPEPDLSQRFQTALIAFIIVLIGIIIFNVLQNGF